MVNIKIKRALRLPRLLAVCGLALLIVVSLKHPLEAQAVTQGYGTDQALQRGMLVKIKKSDTSKIEPVDQDSGADLHGVVVDPNDAPVTLSGDNNKVFVATAGQFDVLTSSQNGAIAAGDYVTISSVAGIGMKASDREPVIIGRALSAFDGKTGAVSSTQIKDSAGATQNVNIGRVKVDIGVAKNPLLRATEPNLPGFLKKATESIAGKEVSPAKAYTALVIFIISTIVSGVLLYGGVRSAITSIGRNPLSKKSIVRGMLQVVLVGLTIFISGIFGVYLLLKL